MRAPNKSPGLDAYDATTLIQGIFAGICAAIIWGLWPVVTRFGVTTDFSPEAIVAVRFIFAAALLLPFYVKRRVYERISVVRSVIIASGAGALYVYVSALGLKFVPAGHLGIVETGTMLALSALGGYLILGEKKSRFQVFGYVLVFAGMIIVNWQSLNLPTRTELHGDLLLVLGGILWASYTVLSKKWNLDAWDAVTSVSVWSLIIWLPLIVIFGDIGLSEETLPAWISQGVSQGIVTAVFGLWFYSVAVSKLGAARGSLFGALVPAIAVIAGFIFLGEQPTTVEMVGVTLTTAGILVSLRM